MVLIAVFFVFAAVLVAPFALWVYVRRSRWRRPDRAVASAYLAVLLLMFATSATINYFYPYGLPGPTERAWRSAAAECERRYAAARTARDTATVDYYQMASTGDEFVPICHTLRTVGLIEARRRCQPSSRCARLRAALRLPPP